MFLSTEYLVFEQRRHDAEAILAQMFSVKLHVTVLRTSSFDGEQRFAAELGRKTHSIPPACSIMAKRNFFFRQMLWDHSTAVGNIDP